MSGLKCPKCKSAHTAIDRQGFGAKKAVMGAVIAGPLGLVAGAINKNKVKNSCGACGHSWMPGEIYVKPPLERVGEPGTTLGYSNSEWISGLVIGIVLLTLLLVFF